MDVDSFGNKIIYGSLKKKHHIFHVLLKGEATIGLSFANKEKDLNKITIYKYQSKYTKPGQNLKEFFEKNYVEKENNYKTAVDLMHKLYKEFIYEKNVTNIKTTAEEAMTLKRGVCQDYSHIMLSLLRMRKIPSRYVVGMLYGEGFSHAWIEVFSDGYWYGLDPTNNIVVSDNHLKISHGRDYHDCIVNKGILNGGGKQTQTIQVILEEKMIKVVSEVDLPVDEKLNIKKNRIEPLGVNNGKRISIVTGIHGDELEGQYVCYKLIEIINKNIDKLCGTVDIYLGINPLGIDSITRGIPAFDLDMNRLFPGNKNGDMMEFTASDIIEDIVESDICIDIHASNIYLKEIPQIRINELHKDKLVPLARMMNVDYIWVHAASTVLESTLAYSLNSRNVNTLVVEMGIGMRITIDYCNQLVSGILNLMKKMGIWKGATEKVREPIISTDKKVSFINASKSGLFIPNREHSSKIDKGDLIGRILNPLEGTVLDEIKSPTKGILFTLREYPIVDEGSLIARILEE